MRKGKLKTIKQETCDGRDPGWRDEEKGGKIKKQLKDLPCLLVWLCWLYTFHLFCGGEISKRIKRAILPLLILSFPLALALSQMGAHTCAHSLVAHARTV